MIEDYADRTYPAYRMLMESPFPLHSRAAQEKAINRALAQVPGMYLSWFVFDKESLKLDLGAYLELEEITLEVGF